jgi:hypothetical protein
MVPCASVRTAGSNKKYPVKGVSAASLTKCHVDVKRHGTIERFERAMSSSKRMEEMIVDRGR